MNQMHATSTYWEGKFDWSACFLSTSMNEQLDIDCMCCLACRRISSMNWRKMRKKWRYTHIRSTFMAYQQLTRYVHTNIHHHHLIFTLLGQTSSHGKGTWHCFIGDCSTAAGERRSSRMPGSHVARFGVKTVGTEFLCGMLLAWGYALNELFSRLSK